MDAFWNCPVANNESENDVNSDKVSATIQWSDWMLGICFDNNKKVLF